VTDTRTSPADPAPQSVHPGAPLGETVTDRERAANCPGRSLEQHEKPVASRIDSAVASVFPEPKES
jgi:hypothetical protein